MLNNFRSRLIFNAELHHKGALKQFQNEMKAWTKFNVIKNG